MFKSLGKVLGRRRKKRKDSAPKVRPGEGIRQVAAVIPPEHEPPKPAKKAAQPQEPAPKAVPETAAPPQALPPAETPAPAREEAASRRPTRTRRTDKPLPPPKETAAAPEKTETKAAPPSKPAPKQAPADTAPAEDRPTRDTLIGEARRIRREKAKALENLPKQDQERLTQLARKMLLGENDEALGGEESPPPGRPSKPPTRH